jgi:hypothetical protein
MKASIILDIFCGCCLGVLQATLFILYIANVAPFCHYNLFRIFSPMFICFFFDFMCNDMPRIVDNYCKGKK